MRIPRFIVRYAEEALPALVGMGFTLHETLTTQDILVVGRSIIQASPIGQAPLLRAFNGNTDIREIIEQAKLHLLWSATASRVMVKVGSADIEIPVTPTGVLVDGFIVPVPQLEKLVRELLNWKAPVQVAAHQVLFTDITVRFITIGCAQYSISDFKQIINAHRQLMGRGPILNS